MRITLSKTQLRSHIVNHSILSSVVVGILVNSPARADTTDQLLDQLKAKGILTRNEYGKLKQRHAAELAAREEKSHKNDIARNRQVIVKDASFFYDPGDRYVKRLDKGLGLKIGNVDVKFNGDITFFGTEVFNPKKGPAIDGSLMNASPNNSFSIRGGLPPSALIVSLATNQMGYDIGATFGFYIGGTNIGLGLLNANSPGAPVALGSPGIDVRQAYGTIGRPDFGSVKIGRDLGLFGGDAIFNNDTIFGAGIPYFNEAPRNTTLGRIGYGYVYADYLPQMTYETPSFNGLTAAFGIFTPIDQFNFTGDSGTMSGHDQPMLQGRLKYVGLLAEGVKLTAWTSAVTQQQRVEVGDLINMVPGSSLRPYAADGGVRLDVGPASVSASGYYGKGLGNSAIFYDGVTMNGVLRNSYGGYAQASYLFYDRLKIGASYGISYLEGVPGDPGTLIRSSGAYVGFARYKLTDWLTLEAEYIHTKSTNQLDQTLDNNALILGTAIVF